MAITQQNSRNTSTNLSNQLKTQNDSANSETGSQVPQLDSCLLCCGSGSGWKRYEVICPRLARILRLEDGVSGGPLRPIGRPPLALRLGPSRSRFDSGTGALKTLRPPEELPLFRVFEGVSLTEELRFRKSTFGLIDACHLCIALAKIPISLNL